MSLARSLIERLQLAPHPEGGWYAETYRDVPAAGGRGAVTHIYYLLEAPQRSAWHRVCDATELWHHYAGGPLELQRSADAVQVERGVLGDDLLAGEAPLLVVPPGVWQAARPLGDWVLVGCTVAPAFSFARYELAPAGWEPGAGPPPRR